MDYNNEKKYEHRKYSRYYISLINAKHLSKLEKNKYFNYFIFFIKYINNNKYIIAHQIQK